MLRARRLRVLRVPAGVCVAAVLGCSAARERPVNAVGSTSVQPFAELLAEEYQRLHPEVRVDVQGGGSTAGIQAVAAGIADIGTCSRPLKPEEAQTFRAITIARDGLAVVVHPENPLTGLTRAQIRDVFSGGVANWRDLGGADREIWPITREEGSGTREAFVKLVMEGTRIGRRALVQESNGSVRELVRHDPGAIGYMSLGLVGEELRAIAIDGIEPSHESVTSGRYPLARPFLFVTKGEVRDEARRFIEFALSPEGRRLLEGEGLVASP